MTENEMARVLTGMKLTLPQWAPKEISRQLACIWLDALKDHSDDEIMKAFAYAAKNLTEWPAPAKIKRICQGTAQTDVEAGAEIAARIEGAISRFGYCNVKQAMESIGEIGAQVVSLCGGWEEVCKTEYSGMLSARKLWRDMATEAHRKTYSDGSFSAPALPRSNILEKALQIAQGKA